MTELPFGEGGFADEEDLLNCLFYQDLLFKISEEDLDVGRSCLSDWLETLSDIELNYLIETVTQLNVLGHDEECMDCEMEECDNCDIYEEFCDDMDEEGGNSVFLKMIDMAHLAALIYTMETGEEKVSFSEDDASEHLYTLGYCACVQLLARDERAEYKEMWLTDENTSAILNDISKESLSSGLKNFFDEFDKEGK